MMDQKAMISQSLYRLLMTLGVIGIATSLTATITLWPAGWPEWLVLIAFCGLFAPFLVILTVKRDTLVRMDEPAWSWWKAGAFIVGFSILVAVAILIINRWV